MKAVSPANSCLDLLLSIFDEYINEERSPSYGESDPCVYSRLLMYEKSGLELGLAFAVGPLGNLAAKKADRPKELAWRAGKALPEERKPLEAARGPGSKVVSGATELAKIRTYLDTSSYYMN